MSAKKLRKSYYVDGKVQGGLLLRAIRYWLLSVSTVGCLTLLGWFFVTPGIPALVGQTELWIPVATVLCVGLGVSLFLMPVVLIDFVKLTHRFAGPIVRLKNSMQALADGETIEPIRFRKGDYWQDVAELFNEVLAKQQAMRGEIAVLKQQLDAQQGANCTTESLEAAIAE